MKVRQRHSSLPWLIAAALLGLLVVLATLQYRWLDEVSAAQRERIRSRLERDAQLFARDFDRELTRVLAYSQMIEPQRHVPGQGRRLDPAFAPAFLDLWESSAPFPELVRGVLAARREASGSFELSRFDAATGEFQALEPSGETAELAERLAEISFVFPPDPEAPLDVLDSRTPAVLVPLFSRGPTPGRPPSRGLGVRDYEARESDRRRSRRRGGQDPRSFGERNRGEPRRFQPQEYLVLWLDPASVLPRLADLHFSVGPKLEFHLRIVDRSDSGRVIFEAGPELEADARGSRFEDAAAQLFGFLSADEIRRLTADLPVEDELRRDRFSLSLALAFSGRHERRWHLSVTHPSGSLETLVAAARRRNLAIGLGVLLLLGATVVMLLVVTRRAQVLARQQIEFVAGVTHELRTPLAAMRSAGENLADGVVRDPAKVARYGHLISREGRRLSDMVEQVLEYAGIHSGRRRYPPERTSVADAVDAVLAEHRRALEDAGFEVEVDLADDLPDVMAEPATLRRALGNLVGNAVKYSDGETWLAIRGRHEAGEVSLSVEDRGAGIAEEDLEQIFEPFYRGRELPAGRIPGSGLGLSLVRQICEAQGARVTVSSRVGEGSVFTLHLPPAAAMEEAVAVSAGLRTST